MSASGPSNYIPSEEDDPRTIVYDPNDPFWHDSDDNDDMDYVPAPGDSDDGEDEDDELNFHGKCICRRSGDNLGAGPLTI